ncbi:MAG TPA: DEAD/DEAH box helicase [Polyangia bacterium]|nr:DEAD/DEAH box helicase [Polyangia bacterium]
MSKPRDHRWHLKPVRHATPDCASYEDEDAVREFERGVRLQRAHAESFRITSAGERVDASYRVAGDSGRAHLVDIVDGSGLHDTCSCPDFLTNQLGTCKHLEAVRRLIGGDRRLRGQLATLGRTPAQPTLTVDALGDAPALRVVGPRARRFARALAVELADDGRVVGDALAVTLAEGAEGRIVHAARPALELGHSRRALAQRRATVLQAMSARTLHLDVLKQPLFPYQQAGVLHLVAAGRALLADDMGLGKTVQTIAACEVLRARGEVRRVLIVTPASLKDQWARELRRYAGVDAAIVSGVAAQRQAALTSDAPYIIINYELTWRDLSQLMQLQADVLVLDEAQRAKNFRTKTATTLRSIPSRFLFVLTGTPIENRLDDLYSLLQLIDPQLLGPLWRFNLQFHQQNERGKIVGYKQLGELRARIATRVLRRRKEEVLAQLPALTEQTRYVALSPAQAELEQHFRSEAAKLMATAERRTLRPDEQQRLMAMLLKARQACDGAELCDPKICADEASPKLDELEQLVGEIVEQGAGKILVFSEWTAMLQLAARRLERMGVGHALLHGGVPTTQRPALLDRFREDAQQRVLLSTDAGGVGLNLQVASYVIHLDLPWNPGRLDQRTARAHRLGQTRGVSVTYLCSETGIERGIEGTLSGKRALRGAALDESSELETMDAPSFSLFLKQLQTSLARAESRSDYIAGDDAAAARAATASGGAPSDASATKTSRDVAPAVIEPMANAAMAPTAAPAPSPSPTASLSPAAAPSIDPTTARGRLRLANVVLDAGFPSDAVKAAYDALARSVAALLPEPPRDGHAALVAAIYRDLLPAGRIPATFHVTLSRLHDLAQLEAHGVAVEAALAAELLRETAQWIDRLDVAGAAAPEASRTIAAASAARN